MTKDRIIIAGGGLVGGVAAAMLADKGHQIDLYELRDDPRNENAAAGRSINLSLSHRGMRSLRQIGMEEECLANGVKMPARMIHKVSGETYEVPYGRTKEHFILSISRLRLNQMILTAAEKRENVNLHFNHRITDVDLSGTLKFSDKPDASGDVLIGADGAYSKVRSKMARGVFDFSQTYIPHGYKELVMDKAENGDWRLPKNYLHIWPRGQFMMIALPNLDGSFTCTLFLPFEMFKTIETQESGIAFMEEHFPDSISIFGRDNLMKQFGPGTTPGLPMISVKTSPHSVDNTVIVGDAAHAIVPFYGQGMNAGMEDIAVLMDTYAKHNDLKSAIKEYGVFRPKDAHAIADLAMYNYIEMRDLVTSNWFLFRRSLDRLLATVLPGSVIPLYEMVVFRPQMGYSNAIERNKKQSTMIDWTLAAAATASLAFALKKLTREGTLSSLQFDKLSIGSAQDFVSSLFK